MNTTRGVTLIELLLTITVLGVLVAVAAPSFTKVILDNRIRSQSSDLLANLAIARSESAKRGVRVTMCTSTDYTSTTPSCSSGGASGWGTGYIMFADVNKNGTFDSTTDVVIKVAEPLEGGNSLVSSGFTTPAAADAFQFRPSGNTNLPPASNASFKLCDSRTGNFGRLISVGVTGRAISNPTTCP